MDAGRGSPRNARQLSVRSKGTSPPSNTRGKDLGDDYAWAADPELDKYAEVARDKLTAESMRKWAGKLAKSEKGGVTIGMTAEDVLQHGWGRPQSINRTTNAYGTHEQWVYPGMHNYLYFDDGVLTTIQH